MTGALTICRASFTWARRAGAIRFASAILATIQGDEPEGALALARFVDVLESNPEIAKGYALFFYPVCNPTGFEDNTSHSRNGKNLDQEFWKNSAEPEVRYPAIGNLDARV